MQIESVEKAELDRDVQVGEGRQLNAVRVELGLASKCKPSTRVSRVSGPSEPSGTETGWGNASK